MYENFSGIFLFILTLSTNWSASYIFYPFPPLILDILSRVIHLFVVILALESHHQFYLTVWDQLVLFYHHDQNNYQNHFRHRPKQQQSYCIKEGLDSKNDTNY